MHGIAAALGIYVTETSHPFIKMTVFQMFIVVLCCMFYMPAKAFTLSFLLGPS